MCSSPSPVTMLNRLSLCPAGPSRISRTIRSVHTSRPASATPKRRVAPATPASRHPSLRSSIPEAQAPVAQAEKARTPPLLSPWPWRTVAKPSRSGMIEEERLVFARPFEMGRPRMYWFGALASGLFFTAWALGPPPARSLPPTDGQE